LRVEERSERCCYQGGNLVPKLTGYDHKRLSPRYPEFASQVELLAIDLFGTKTRSMKLRVVAETACAARWPE
jgi:hypothetical protein